MIPFLLFLSFYIKYFYIHKNKQNSFFHIHIISYIYLICLFKYYSFIYFVPIIQFGCNCKIRVLISCQIIPIQKLYPPPHNHVVIVVALPLRIYAFNYAMIRD